MIPAVRAAWPAVTCLVGLLVSIVAAAVIAGGASTLVAVRATVLVALVLAIAAVLGAVTAASAVLDDARRGRLLDLAAGAAALWTVAAAATVFLLYLGEAPAISSGAFGPGLVSFVADVAIGRTWLVAAVAAAVLTAALVAFRSRGGAVGLLVLSAAATVPVALQQPPSGLAVDTTRVLAGSAWVQLVAVASWLGALVVGRGGRVLPVSAFLAVVIATAAAGSDGAVTGAAVATVVLVGAAGVLAIVVEVTRRGRPLLVRAEQVLLAAAIGLGVVSELTRPAPAVPARTTPAEILTGSPLPPPMSVGTLLTTWVPDPLWIVVAVALLVGYLVAVRRSGPAWPVRRTVGWVVGVLVLVWLTSGGPARYAALDLGAYLGQHAALALVVPTLLAAGAPVRLLRASVVVPSVRPLHPIAAVIVTVLVAVAVLGSGLLRWTVSAPLGTEAGVLGSVLAGAIVVHALAAPGTARRSAVVAAVGLLVAETAGAAVLATGSSLLLADWFGALGWGTDALAAQRAAAIACWPVATVPTAALLAVVIRAPRTTRSSFVRTGAVTP